MVPTGLWHLAVSSVEPRCGLGRSPLYDLRFRVQGAGCRVQGAGFRVPFRALAWSLLPSELLKVIHYYPKLLNPKMTDPEP